MGSNTLKIGWKPAEAAELTMERANRALGDVATDPPMPSPLPPQHRDELPQRKHSKPLRAKARGPWWAVLRIPKDTAHHGKPMFFHPTRETAEAEAEYLSNLAPGILYIVIEAVSWYEQNRPCDEAIAAE